MNKSEISVLQQAIKALDLSQALLEKSSHHSTILAAYTALAEAITQPVQPPTVQVPSPLTAQSKGFVVSVLMIKNTATGCDTLNHLFKIDAANIDEAHGKALRLSQVDFPEYRLHGICSFCIQPLTDQSIDAMWSNEKLTLPQLVNRRVIARAIEAAHAIAPPVNPTVTDREAHPHQEDGVEASDLPVEDSPQG